MNFARRTDCFSCFLPKQVAPTIPPAQAEDLQHQHNFQPPRPPQQNNWQQQQYSNDPRDEETKPPARSNNPEGSFSSPTKAQLTKQLEQFEPMFSNWENQFEEWKQQNRNNP